MVLADVETWGLGWDYVGGNGGERVVTSSIQRYAIMGIIKHLFGQNKCNIARDVVQ